MGAEVLRKDIKDRSFKRLYLLWGEEDYLKTQYCARLTGAAVAKGMESFNLHRFYGDSFDLKAFAEAVTNMPLMSEYKCVVLRDIAPESFGQSQWKDFTALLAEIPEGCVVILHFDALRPDKRSSRFKSLLTLAQKHGAAVELTKPTQGELEKWTYQKISQNGASIAPACLRYLLEYCGGDMNSLANEIEKLTAYANGGEIVKEDVDSLAVRPLSASVYDLSKAILAGNAARAYKILDGLFYQKEEPVVILATLSGAFCDLYRAKMAVQSGASQAEVERDFNYKGREFRVRNALRDCRATSLGYLERSLDLLFEADRKLKSSPVDKRVLFDELVAGILGLRAAQEPTRRREGGRA